MHSNSHSTPYKLQQYLGALHISNTVVGQELRLSLSCKAVACCKHGFSNMVFAASVTLLTRSCIHNQLHLQSMASELCLGTWLSASKCHNRKHTCR